MRKVGFTLFLACALAAAAAAKAEPLRINYRVVGETPISDGLRACIGATLRSRSDYVVVDQLPLGEVLVYASVDASDGVNPKGISLAVAFLDHLNAQHMAKLFLLGPKASSDPEVKAAVGEMLVSPGELDRLNVIHVGQPDAAAVRAVCKDVTEEFFVKFPTGN